MIKRLFYLLEIILALTLGRQNLMAGDFTPEVGQKYCVQAYGTQLFLGADSKGGAVLESALKLTMPYYVLRFLPVDGGYNIINDDGNYLYYKGYSMSFKAYDESTPDAYVFDFVSDTKGGYRISVVKKGSYVAPDNVGDGSAVYSDKGATHANGRFDIVSSDILDFNPAIKFDAESVSVEYDNDGAENSANIMFTPLNFDGKLTLAPRTDAFKVSETTVEAVDGETVTVEVSSKAAIGTKDVVDFIYDGNVLASVPVEVVKASPAYYIMNIATGLVIGGEQKAVLAERSDDPSQFFKKVPVPGTVDQYYFIQKSSGLYLKRVDSGDGVFTFYVEIGANNKATWKLTPNGNFYSIKNTTADRILMPNKLSAGSELLLYGLNTDPGTQWELIDATEISKGEPYVEVTDKNVVVEKNGLTFTTKVRAFNLDGSSVKVVASDKVSTSLTSISEGFDFSSLTISTSAEPGTECEVKFVLGDKVAQALKFTVQPKFERYIIRALQPKTINLETGEVVEPEKVFAISNDEGSIQPILKEVNPKDVSQWYLFVPADAEKQTYYIVQDGTFANLAKSDKDNYNTTLDLSKDREWTIEKLENDSVVIRNTVSAQCLGPGKYEAGAVLYANRGKNCWKLEALGRMELDKDEVVLVGKDDSQTVNVAAANLKDDINVTVSDGFTVDKTSLPKEGGTLAVGYDKSSFVLEGSVTFTSGIYTETLKVRLKNTAISVDKDAIELVGKNASAQFIVNATDWEKNVKVSVKGEGFSVDVDNIEPAAVIAKVVNVAYSGRKSGTGKVVVESGDFKKVIALTATIYSKIIINEGEDNLEFDETGSAYFSITANDLFEDISVEASSDKVVVEPALISAEADGEYVFLTYEDGAKQYNVNVTFKSGDVVKTVTVKGAAGEAPATGVESVADANDAFGLSVVNGVLHVSGIIDGYTITVADIAGRSVNATDGYVFAAKGVYIIKVVDQCGKTVKTAKVVCK